MTGLRVARLWIAALGVTALAVLASLFLVADPALAHASLKSSTPANGTNIAEAPRDVVLRFTEAVNPASVVVAVRGSDGATAVEGSPQVTGAVVVQPLRATLPVGHFTVTFQVVSVDGHRISGILHFALVSSGAAPSPGGSSAPVDHGAHQQPAPEAVEPVEASSAGNDPPAVALATAAGTAFGAIVLLWWWLAPLDRGRRRQPKSAHRLLGPVPETGTFLAAAGVLAAAAAVVAGLAFGGGAARSVLPGLPDPGAATAWLVPVARLGMTVAAVTTVGLLLAGVFFSPVRAPLVTHRRELTTRRGLSDSGQGWLRAAGWAAAVWCATAVVTLWLSCADISGHPAAEAPSTSQLATFATGTPIGLALAAVAVLAGLLAWACRVVRGPAGVFGALTLALLAVVPPVFTGHTASGRVPQVATSGLVLHVVPVTLWAGGLLALALSMRAPVGNLALAVSRFSPLAGTCFVAVGVSGLLAAWLHLPDLGSLTGTSYGRLIMAKAGLLAVIAAVGWWHQRWSMPALRGGSRRSFARLAAVEVLLFGAVVGLAMALSRTTPPQPTLAGQTEHTGHVMATGDHPLLGYPMPPRPSVGSLLTWWLPEPLFVVAAVGAVGLYLAGVRRLRRRGPEWPLRRTAAWVAGCAVVVAATSTGVAQYAPTMPSVYLIRHALVAVVVPLLLILAAPTELARAVLPLSDDVEWPGPREWLAAAVHSRAVRLIDRPVLVLVAFGAGFPVVYFGGLYEAALRSPAVHLGLLLWSALAGMMFFRALLPVGSARMPAPRWLAFAGAGALAAVGVIFMASSVDPAAGWFAELARPWYVPGERYRAGAVILILGALPVLIAGVASMRRRTAVSATASAILPARPGPASAGLDEVNRPDDATRSLAVGRR
jgi:cytochrome c oxidase assembly factor CtaG/methionine-rich copper-binding protein CopC/putative copper export protein